jgi:Cof subfamily protein (haloacid dehalogenase superfamily)
MTDLGELPFKGKLLVCDMDGTILNSKGFVSKENVGALERFVEGGGYFTIATGRMERSVAPYLKSLPLNVPAILYNGAVIYDFAAEEVLWQNCLPDGMEFVLQKVMKRFPDIGIEIFNGGDIYYIRQNAETDAHKIRENLVPLITSLDNVPKPWYKALMAWEPSRLLEVEEFLKEIHMEIPFHSVYSEPQFLELLNCNASKGHALKELTAMLEYPCSCVIAMGDNLNDVEMIKAANIGIAVGNAHKKLKIAADLCCCHHDSHAAAEVINWIESKKIVC